jgi:hypothetical protein
MARKHLLIVANTPSENTRVLRDAVVRGAQSPGIEDVEVRAVNPLEAGPEDVLAAQGIILGTTENLGYMLRHPLIFYSDILGRCFGKWESREQGIFVHAKLPDSHDCIGEHLRN